MAGGDVVDGFRQLSVPETVEIGAAGRAELGAHFQAVGLDQIQRPQHAVEARKNAQVILGVDHVLVGQGIGLEADVGVAIEHQRRLLGVG